MKNNFNDIDFSSRGFYKTGLFNLFINGRLSDLSTMNKKDQGTFIHEYIHFLQNITTLLGLRFSSFYIDFIIRLIKWLREKDNIYVPINIQDIFIDGNLKDNFDFFSTLSGSTKHFNFDMNQDIYWRFGANGKNEIIHLKIKDSNGMDQNVLFGSHAIKESMASLYQTIIDDKANDSQYEYPYKSATYIVNHLFPSLAHDTKKIICICQIALDSPSPARDLLKWLLFATNNPNKNGIELYALHMDESYFSYKNSNDNYLEKYTVKELLDQSIEKFISKLHKILLYKNKNYVGVLSSIKSLTDIHLRSLYVGDNLIHNIKMIMKICGVPFIYNDFGERIHLCSNKYISKNTQIDDDISFLLSLCNICTSFLLTPEECNCRCIFRTMFCNHCLKQEELDNHIYCFDQPWKEEGCNYWHILDMLGINHKKIHLKNSD